MNLLSFLLHQSKSFFFFKKYPISQIPIKRAVKISYPRKKFVNSSFDFMKILQIQI